MALSGIQIFQKLPKDNCKECGLPTCMAFAMAVAGGKIEYARCPRLSEEARAFLEDAASPPIRTVEIGTGNRVFRCGGETVLYRHEKTFVNPTGIGVMIYDDDDAQTNADKIARLDSLQYERIGTTLSADLLVLGNRSGDTDRFSAFVADVASKTDAPLVLAADINTLDVVATKLSDRRPLLFLNTKNFDEQTLLKLAEIGKRTGCAVSFRSADLSQTQNGARILLDAGVKDFVLDAGAANRREAFEHNVAVRRIALAKTAKEFGAPTIAFAAELSENADGELLTAAVLIAKYAGIVVLSDLQGHTLFPLLLQRLNLFTDPQRPMKTEQGVYEIGKVHDRSPVVVTCNFSLTYFIVSGEIEASRVPARLLVVDTDGLSVLTAWAAGKFVGDVIADVVRKQNLGEALAEKRIILPGQVAVIKGDLEEELGPEWTVEVGPREANQLPAFLRENFE